MPLRNSAPSVVILLLLLAGIAVAELPGEDPITTDDREHWSFQPLQRPAVPDVNDAGWCRTPVDRFILSELEERGLQPMPPADRQALLRRVTYDLTGLPPTPEELQSFLADDQPGAYQRIVDQLLASPAYGERWGQHWLDLARFAETDGFEHDHVRPNAWRYRDWVIEALNDDLPYDEFVRLQLAGDEVRPDDPNAAIATGFLLCGPDMPDINLLAERRHNFLNDMTGTVGAVLLGLQIGCAACHDHKYDPISQADFYRLRAFFDPAEIFGEREIPTAEEQAAIDTFEAERARRWKELEAQISTLKREQTNAARDKRVALEKEVKQLKQADPPAPTMGRVVRNPRKAADPSHLWIRGDFRRPGPELQPAFLRVVAYETRPDATTSRHPTPESRSPNTRTALADWLVSDSHPLTSRVIANRLWHYHFGRGIVGTTSDLGIMGDWPTHPELLDWLACELVEQDWSLKAMHRLLVTSSVYRTASRPQPVIPAKAGIQQPTWEQLLAEDPHNELLGRMRRQRLDGEAIRDGMVAAAGLLNRQATGPGIRPPLSKEVTSTLLKNQWPVTKDTSQYDRRSVYLFVRRNLPFPLLSVFDRPDTNQSCPERNQTTIAPQALHLLNSDFSLGCAEALAQRVRQMTPDDQSEQIRQVYKLALSRPPSDEELAVASQFLDEAGPQGLVDYCLAVIGSNFTCDQDPVVTPEFVADQGASGNRITDNAFANNGS